jgi:arylsulfatase A-like enzyme
MPVHPPHRAPLRLRTALGLAVALGVACGYLDLVFMLWKKHFWIAEKCFWSGRDFVWTVPLTHAALLALAALPVSALGRLLPGKISLRIAVWILATLALWWAFLRMPIHGAAALLLAAGLGRPLSSTIVSLLGRPRLARAAFGLALGSMIVLGALTSGRMAVLEARAVAALPATPPGARNVLVIVWDTVRAQSLSVYGYGRATTPNLDLRARRGGVVYARALAPAPWTLPSHTTAFTGIWPYQLNTQCTYSFDARVPTLAEFLASRGYQTAGFAANTNCCSWENGLDRGFLHYEDYWLSPWTMLGRTVPGQWLLLNVLNRGGARAAKWIRFQSRDARDTDEAFLGWLDRRRQDRPFFAFLNHFDAHGPYLPPSPFRGQFSRRPKRSRDDRFLVDLSLRNVSFLPPDDLLFARDSYDECIASLDAELGRLLDQLQARGVLDNTIVVLASDHGEEFGDHGAFGHGTDVFFTQVMVPLVILFPDAPAGRVVMEPVSLRDLPATVLDQLGLAAGSPFPGRSLAVHWRPTPSEAVRTTSPALSEVVDIAAFGLQPEPSSLRRVGFQMSLVARGRHYVRDGLGDEHLYDLARDPLEQFDLASFPEARGDLEGLRKDLLGELAANPGAPAVENAYLRPYRQWLDALVRNAPGLAAQRAAMVDSARTLARPLIATASTRVAPPPEVGSSRPVSDRR